PIKAAAVGDDELHGEPINHYALKLQVPPSLITSWGYLPQAGFVARVTDVKFDATPAAADAAPGIVAVSANPSILAEVNEPSTNRSPAYPLRNFLTVDISTRGLIETASVRELAKKKEGGIKMAAWQEELLASSKAAKRPDRVHLYHREDVEVGSELDTELRTEVGAEWKLAFRAAWVGDNLLKL